MSGMLGPIERFASDQNRQCISNRVTTPIGCADERAVKFSLERYTVAIPHKALLNPAVDPAEFVGAGHAERGMAQGRT
jgi:hypothetical protein